MTPQQRSILDQITKLAEKLGLDCHSITSCQETGELVQIILYRQVDIIGE